MKIPPKPSREHKRPFRAWAPPGHVRERTHERGTAIIEFPLAGIPLIMLVMLVFEICIAMWSYHTLASAVKEGAIYASTKGQDCTYTGNTCQASIAQIVQRILAAGVGIDSTRLNLTFHSNASGSTDVPCNPAGSCSSNATLWPPASGGIPNLNYIEITASYPAPISIPALLWPGQSLSRMGTIQFSASSRQVIQF